MIITSIGVVIFYFNQFLYGMLSITNNISWGSLSCCNKLVIDNKNSKVFTFYKLFNYNLLLILFSMYKSIQSIKFIRDVDCSTFSMIAVKWFYHNGESNSIYGIT